MNNLLSLEVTNRKNPVFILSTHSPILMCLPEAKLLRMTEDTIEQTTPEETSHFQMTKYILNNKEKFFRSLRG